WLYSQHDIAVHTTERYSIQEIRRMMGELGLEITVLTYRLCTLFVPLALLRLRSIIQPSSVKGAVQSDLHRTAGRGLNRLLFTILRTENWLISRGKKLPFGSSVFAVGRKY
ncbi:uncharacterized protein METZ01_LOCUS251310, partial [marine metagenome]